MVGEGMRVIEENYSVSRMAAVHFIFTFGNPKVIVPFLRLYRKCFVTTS